MGRRTAMTDLTHIDDKGRARMVDIGDKPVTRRRAVALARLLMEPATFERIMQGNIPKGDVVAVARTAGVMAAKRTDELIPLCHPLAIDSTELSFDGSGGELRIEAVVSVTDRTGAEMEALMAASVAALTVYDMCKAVDRSMHVAELALIEKSGGRSGDYRRS
jgi:cyclic pyranopterin phosphate synthase